MGALEGISTTDRNYLERSIGRLLLKADEPYPINSVEESDTEDGKQYTLQIKGLSTFPQGSFGRNYTELEEFKIDILGSKATLSAVSMEKLSDGDGSADYIFTYLDMTLVREGEGPMPVAPLPEGFIRVDGVEYQEIDDEENNVAVARIPDDMTHLTVPATVESSGKKYNVTQIKLSSVNAVNIKEVTLEANPLLNHIEMPQIENLYIQESPSQWAQKNFTVGRPEDERYYNGIERAQTVYFNGEKVEHITFGEDLAYVGVNSFTNMKQLKRVTFLGYPKIAEYAFWGTGIKRIDSKELAPALKTGQLGINYNADIYIGGKKLTVLVIPDKIGKLSNSSIICKSVEYLYIPKSSDVYLDYYALVLTGLKAAYIDKEDPPMRSAVWDEDGDYPFPGIFGPYVMINHSEHPDPDFYIYIPGNAYNNYKEGSSWYEMIHSFSKKYWYNVAPFDFGKDKLPFPVK